MVDFINSFVQTFVNQLSVLGPVAGILLIWFESILPILPLGVFISFNMVAFGKIFGFLLSWAATCIGCFASFWIFRCCLQKKLYRFINKNDCETLGNIMNVITKCSFTSLVLLIACPFSPAFLINIAAGLSKMRFRKFFVAILISKIVLVYFWGYVGTSLIESFMDIEIVIKVLFMIAGAYFVSKLVERKLKIR